MHMISRHFTDHARSVLAMFPNLSVLSLAEQALLEKAAERSYLDRGRRPVFEVALLPTRLANQIYGWGRVAPEVIIDEVVDAIESLSQQEGDTSK
ncbi:TPA: hypothetical protein ACKPGA_001475 [Pseudomonas aeruginosa]|uniref:hypothetical protein n=1 Tax=Pseudomonas aeruginosa TaxID=287 RepID=UPI0012370FCA|nr:hypothetical protein [Pseudomonas aeruginosa]